MHLAESSSTLFCLWTGLSLPVALHPASQRCSYLQLRTGQCSRPEGTFTLLLVRTFRRTFPRHFVPGYDRVVPAGRAFRHFAMASLIKACCEMSRRDGAIVAWHEVPGTAPPQKSRPVGYGLIRAGVRTDSMIGVTKFRI